MIPLSKKEPEQPFNIWVKNKPEETEKLFHKTHQSHHCHGRRPWMLCLSLELITSHTKGENYFA